MLDTTRPIKISFFDDKIIKALNFLAECFHNVPIS